MPSKKQLHIYKFIVWYTQKHGEAPTLDEIAKHFSDFLQYPSSARYHVQILIDEGYLDRESNKPRSIGIYKEPMVKKTFLDESTLDAVRIPLLGTANAGPATLFADQNIFGYIRVPGKTIKKSKDIFALRIQGDSMNRARINGKNIENGDIVLIDGAFRKPRKGDYVLSVIDGCANVKRFDFDENLRMAVLNSESKNEKHKPIFLASDDDFMINGKIIDVVKR